MSAEMNEVCQDYESTLQELKNNSKPHINMLTMLADENQRYASKITQIIESRIEKVPPVQKLPLLYLIDSIVKNCPNAPYRDCFARNLPNTFVNVFKNSDEKVRASLFKLRNTWTACFPASKLCALDIKVNEVDPKWPIRNDIPSKSTSNKTPATNAPSKEEIQQRELLLRLQQQKLELELKKAQESLKLQQKQLEHTRNHTLKRASPSPVEIPVGESSRIRSPGLLGDAPICEEVDSCGGRWLPLKKVKLENNDTVDVCASVSGLNDRTTTPVPQTPAPAQTPVPSATPLPSSTPVPADKPASLDSVPVNNRIYVDGRGYEVRFIEDSAVIERNGLPHRISFVGPPKDVVIDGIPHSLKFEETKDIYIDGQLHTIKFGAPSREIYLGKVPLRGSFGGPPIFLNINGTKHKIQLCGPPPEVKIDPEPSYELIRFMRSSHRNQGPVHDYGSSNQSSLQRPSSSFTPQAPSSSRPSLPPTTVLAQTQQVPTVNIAEILAKLAPIIQPPVPTKPPTPPIAATVRFQGDEVVQRAKYAPLNLKDFNPTLFKTRYKNVIDLLYQKTLQCSTCGLRFVDGDTQKYSKHLDWHFKQNRKDKTITKTNCRPWYFAADDWVNFEELGEDSSTKSRSEIFDQAHSRHSDTEHSLISTDSVIVANDQTQNYCSVCGDKFEQFWDEDEEAWKLRNATLIHGKVYHPLCFADVENGEYETNPTVCDIANDNMWTTIAAGASGTTNSSQEKTAIKVEPLDNDYISVQNDVVKTEPVDDYFM